MLLHEGFPHLSFPGFQIALNSARNGGRMGILANLVILGDFPFVTGSNVTIIWKTILGSMEGWELDILTQIIQAKNIWKLYM